MAWEIIEAAVDRMVAWEIERDESGSGDDGGGGGGVRGQTSAGKKREISHRDTQLYSRRILSRHSAGAYVVTMPQAVGRLALCWLFATWHSFSAFLA